MLIDDSDQTGAWPTNRGNRSMKGLVLDAMGVILQAGDDAAELPTSFVAGLGGAATATDMALLASAGA